MVVALGGALRALFAYNAFYDPEELIRVRIAHAEPFSRFILESKMDMTPFLDIFVIRLFYHIFESELAVRICQAGIGVFFLIVLCILSSRMLGDGYGGLFVSAIAAISPLHTFYSCIVRYHNLNAIFTLVAIYFFWKIVEKGGHWKDAVAFGLFAAGAMMTQYYTIYLFAALFAYLVIFNFRKLPRLAPLAGIASLSFMFFFLPFFKFFLFQINKVNGASITFRELAAGIFTKSFFNLIDSIFGFILGDFYLIHGRSLLDRTLLFSSFAILAAFLLLFLWLICRRNPKREIIFPAFILGFILVISYITREASTAAISAKYYLPFTFLFYMIITHAIISINARVVKAALATSVIAVLALAQVNLYHSFTEKTTVKTVAANICDDIAEGGAVLFSAEAIGMLGFGKIDYSHEMALEYFAEYAPCAANVALVDDGRFPGRTRLRPGKLNVVKLISPGDTESIEALLIEHGRLWLFYFNLGREPHEHLKREILPTEAYRTLAKLAPPAESVIFKVSPRRDYFKGGAFLFLK
ncbi:MAG TPA: glycosyltransferase family 39 protein [bacterium]|nr:glycosyltransferase family 39 protein [bacterium]